MLFITTTFWMLAIVFVAYGIFELWAGMVRPRIINLVLLPGTIVAQLGHITGVLMTGGTMDDVKNLIATDIEGSPTQKEKKGSSLLVSIIVAMVPMVACGLAIYMIMTLSHTGWAMLSAAGTHLASETLPTDLPTFWAWLHDSLKLVEDVTQAIFSSDYNQLESWFFLYLLTCLTVRLAPLPGTQRGAVLAILILGTFAGLMGLFSGMPEETIQRAWHLGSFLIATLLFLMIVSLAFRGGVGLYKILANK